MQEWKIIGLMSGTSLDGLDIAYITFRKEKKWTFHIGPCQTIPYPEPWLTRLKNAMEIPGIALTQLDREYGIYLGTEVSRFIHTHQLAPDFISSHGHTLFHQPEAGFSLQIGHGGVLAATCGLPVVNDFRSSDIALGGNGAPLVPTGDALLFPEYPVCLNLGGFANISGKIGGRQVAWDICPFNTVLNYLAEKTGLTFDKEGQMARSGKPVPGLLQYWEQLDYFSKAYPKSLGIEWVKTHIFPTLDQTGTLEDMMHSYVMFAASMIARDLEKTEGEKVLVTGGGAYHTFFMETLKTYTQKKIYIPEKEILEYKEALIFALLGLLRWNGEHNVWHSVTGASRDHSAGAIYTA